MTTSQLDLAANNSDCLILSDNGGDQSMQVTFWFRGSELSTAMSSPSSIRLNRLKSHHHFLQRCDQYISGIYFHIHVIIYGNTWHVPFRWKPGTSRLSRPLSADNGCHFKWLRSGDRSPLSYFVLNSKQFDSINILTWQIIFLSGVTIALSDFFTLDYQGNTLLSSLGWRENGTKCHCGGRGDW